MNRKGGVGPTVKARVMFFWCYESEWVAKAILGGTWK